CGTPTQVYTQSCRVRERALASGPDRCESPRVHARLPIVSVAMALAAMGGLALAGPEAAGPPREWIEPATGHRVVRLSDEPGSASLYFHQNAYTASGDKLLISVPDGLATVDLATRRLDKVVSGRVSHVVVGPRTRQVFYIKEGTVYATHLDTRA